MRATRWLDACARALLFWGLATAASAEGSAAERAPAAPAAETAAAAPLGSARYGITPAAVYSELAEMAGGARRVAQRARHHLPKEPELALLLAEIALEASPRDPAVLRTMRDTLAALQQRARLGERFEGEGPWLEARKGAIEERLIQRGPR